MTVYDAANRVRSKVEPKSPKLLLSGRLPFVRKFRPANLEPGIYRVDLFRDGLPIWRAGFAIVD
jgi:hypothetical protein